jgi:hypothetical protein
MYLYPKHGTKRASCHVILHETFYSGTMEHIFLIS